MASRFVQTRRVEYVDTDMAGIVHYSRFFLYMEQAEHAFFRSLGLSVHQEIDGAMISWPRVSCAFDFRRPLFFEDTFEVRLFIEAISSRTVRYRAEIFRDDTYLATGRSTSVCCRVEPGGSLKAVPIPHALRSHFEVDPAPPHTDA